MGVNVPKMAHWDKEMRRIMTSSEKPPFGRSEENVIVLRFVSQTKRQIFRSIDQRSRGGVRQRNVILRNPEPDRPSLLHALWQRLLFCEGDVQ